MSDTPPTPRRVPWGELLALALVLLFGAGLRLAWLGEAARSPEFAHPLYDPQYNAYWAAALVTGDWTPPEGMPDPEIRTTPYGRPPGYPFFLAGVYALFGVGDWPPRIVQLSLGLLNALLAWLLARRLFGPGAAFWTALFMAGYWVFPYYETQLTYPAVVALLVLLLMHAAAAWAARPRTGLGPALGLLLGLFALFRPNGLLFLPALLLWMWGAARRRGLLRRWLPAAALLALGLLAVTAPVFVRNYRVARDFVFLSSYGGINFLVGNNAEASLVEPRVPGLRELAGVDNWSCFDYPAIVRGVARKLNRDHISHSEANRYFYREGLDFIAHNPGLFLKNTLRKTLLFWGPREVTNDTVVELDKQRSAVLGPLPGFPLLLALFLAGAGAWMLSRRRGAGTGAGAALLFVPVYFLSVVPYFIAGRYRVPLLPCMILFAGYGVAFALGSLRRGAWRPALAWAAAAALLWLAASRDFAGYTPSEGTWHLRRALAHTEGGDLESAAKEYLEALETGADPSLVCNNLGRLRARAGDAAGAREWYGKALAHNPANTAAHLNLGVEAERSGAPAAALEHYRRAVETNAFFAPARGNLGRLLLETGAAAEAVEHLAEAARLRPADPYAVYDLGRARAAAGDPPGAAEEYARALALKPDFAEAHNNLGWLLAVSGHPAEAAEHYRAALAARPDFLLARINLGNALLDLGKAEDAEAEFQRALEADPGDARALYSLGRCAEARGDAAAAAERYQKAAEADPAFAAAWNNLGFMRARLGDAPGAEAAYRRALEADPAFLTARVNLGALLCALGRADEGRAELAAAAGQTADGSPERQAVTEAAARCGGTS